MIEWATGVNKLIRRNTDGEFGEGVILEETRSGKKKSRPANQLTPDTFNVEMQFKKDEFITFRNWWKVNLRKGVLTFSFPDIFTKLTNKEYRILGKPSWSNPSADIFIVKMEWEEVE